MTQTPLQLTLELGSGIGRRRWYGPGMLQTRNDAKTQEVIAR